MNPDFLPAIGRALRTVGEFTARGDITDQSLTDLAAELERALRLVRSAQAGRTPGGSDCIRHPGGPVDPAAENGCLLCGSGLRAPARPMPDGVDVGDVLRCLIAQGSDVATTRYGALAVTRALAVANRRPAGDDAPRGPAEGGPVG